MAEYELWLSTDAAERLTTLDLTGGFEYVKQVNGIGWFNVDVSAGVDLAMAGLTAGKPDHLVEIWRSVEGVRKTLEMVGFLRWVEIKHDSNGQLNITIGGPDQNELLHRRIVAFAAGESESSKSAEADDMMKEIVDENLGSSAAAGRDITGLGFSIQSDQTAGPSVELDFPWRWVDQALEQIADAADTAGTRVYYGVEAIAPDEYEFVTWITQPGHDRTDPDDPVIFSLERGNLAKPLFRLDYTDEVNYVYAGGQDVAADRNIQEVSDTTRINASIWNRREVFQDAREADTDAAVVDAGDARLAQGMPVRRFTGEVVDTPQALYGKDWGLGDRVISEYLGGQYDCIIKAVKVRVDGDGNEMITAKLEWES